MFYEAKFNLGACYFKHGKFQDAHRMFCQLMAMTERGDTRSGFVGRDRRLYYNKALCELQMGQFDRAIKTCSEYLKPIKQAKSRVKELEQIVK